MLKEQSEGSRRGAVSEKAAKQAVADAGRMLLRERLVARTWGNVSCRTGERSFVITPSGLGYDHMGWDDVVSCDMAGDTWSGPREPSSEKGVHTAAYRRFADAGAVIHTHQTYASALGLAGSGGLSPSKDETSALGGIAPAKYGLPGSEQLTENVAEALGQGAHIVLMANHGALIVGRDMDEAFRRAALLEDVCRSVCRGQPECDGEEAPGLRQLTELAKGEFRHVAFTSAPAVRKVSETVLSFRAQLDDMAQMIGPRLLTVGMNVEPAVKALKKQNTVLISGGGAICRADTAGDCDALLLLVEKACVSFLHTRALGVSAALSYSDALYMRRAYLDKYSKKIVDKA